jgi:hypothetical protein
MRVKKSDIIARQVIPNALDCLPVKSSFALEKFHFQSLISRCISDLKIRTMGVQKNTQACCTT